MSRSCAWGHSSAGLSGLSALPLTGGRETGLPSLDSWKERRMDVSSVRVFGRERQWATGIAWLLPPASARVRDWETPWKLQSQTCLHLASGALSWPQVLLGSQSCWGRAPWDPPSLVIPDNSTEADSSFQCP